MEKVRKEHGDLLLVSVVIVLLILGVLMVYSASSFRGQEKYGDSATFLKSHVIRVVLGLFCLFIFSRIDYSRLRWITPFLLLLLLGLLVIALSGQEINGSRRTFPLFGKRIQPSEFMKLVLIFYIAALFAKGKQSPIFQSNNLFIQYALLLGVVGLVFIEPDLGTALVLFFIGMTMFYLGGIAWKKLSKLSLFLVPLVSIGMAVFPYQKQRLFDYWGSVFGSGDTCYQVKQSIIGLAHGGLLGVGYGGGKQKLFFLPEPFSDFILASVGEELGFIGIVFLFLLLLIVLWRGIRIALRAPDRYGYLLAGGITAMILINGIMNAGVAVNLLPTTGLPFPFISYGGSSLFTHLIGVGILLNISRKRVMPYKEYTYAKARKGRWTREL